MNSNPVWYRCSGWHKQNEAMLGGVKWQVNAQPGTAIEGGKIQPPARSLVAAGDS